MTRELLEPTAESLHDTLAAAFPADCAVPDRGARHRLFRELHSFYTAYLAGPASFASIPRLGEDGRISAIEHAWQEWEDAQVDLAQLPATAADFEDWFLTTAAEHTQPEFSRYLAEDATLSELALFFLAEEMVDSRFDDLVALAQIGASGITKLAIAENYWDEMGEGQLDRMHTRLFDHSARYMRACLADIALIVEQLDCPEIYENACVPMMYGIHRHLAPRMLGALGIIEHSAPPRFEAMVAGCTRLGVPDDVVEYQRVHVHVDDKHGRDWVEHVFMPLVSTSPALLREISIGVATRVRVANAYYCQIHTQMVQLRS